MPYITFQKGILQATRNYEAVEILNNEIKDYNKAKYFLVSSTEEFNLEKATYPLPLYEYQTVEDDKNSVEDRFQTGFNEWKDSLYVPEKHPENTFKFGEKEIQFYKEKYKLLWKDECDSEYENYISTILNPKLIHSKYYFSCEHFSGDLISTINKKSGDYNYLNTYSASGEKYSKKVYSIIKTKNKKEILKILNRFKSILLKHKIENNLNVDVYTNYLVKNDFIAKKILIYDQKPYYTNTRTPNFKNPEYYDTRAINAYYFEEYDYKQLIENCNTAFTHEFEYSVFWIFYMICFIASLIVIVFEVFPIIQIFISIAIFGVIFTANVLIQVLIQYSLNHNYYIDREIYAVVHCFIIVTLFLAYAIISQNWKGKKWLTTQFTLIGLFVVGGFIPFTIMILDKSLTYETMSKCSGTERIHSIFYPYINIFVFSITFFLSIIAYTSILKKYTSKKE